MKKMSWNQDLPEVPEMIHSRVLNTLSTLDEAIVEQEINVPELEQYRSNKFSKKRFIILVAAVVALLGTTVVAAEIVMKQKQIHFVKDQKELAEHTKGSTVGAESYVGESFDLEEKKPIRDWSEDWINNSEANVQVENGTSETLWTKKIKEIDEQGLSVGYVYPCLSEAFKDHKIGLDMSYIESNYPSLWEDKGCQYYYKTEDESKLRNFIYFCGYKNNDSQYVFLQYNYDPNETNEEEYKVEGNYESVGSFTTEDGVKLTITTQTAKTGYAITYAEMITEHGRLYITLRGKFTEEEQEVLYNSLKLSSICV